MHGRLKHTCRECGASKRCLHGRMKDRCLDCGGGYVCPHNRLKYNCNICIALKEGLKSALVEVGGSVGQTVDIPHIPLEEPGLAEARTSIAFLTNPSPIMTETRASIAAPEPVVGSTLPPDHDVVRLMTGIQTLSGEMWAAAREGGNFASRLERVEKLLGMIDKHIVYLTESLGSRLDPTRRDKVTKTMARVMEHKGRVLRERRLLRGGV